MCYSSMDTQLFITFIVFGTLQSLITITNFTCALLVLYVSHWHELGRELLKRKIKHVS